MDAGALSDVLNLDTYPLDEPGSSKWTRLVEQKRADWSTNGAMRLAGLVRPGALVQVASELARCSRRLPSAIAQTTTSTSAITLPTYGWPSGPDTPEHITAH